MDLLSLTSEKVMGRVIRIKRYVRNVAMHLKETDVWMYETAVMLSQIGCITMPESILKKSTQESRLKMKKCASSRNIPYSLQKLYAKFPAWNT